MRRRVPGSTGFTSSASAARALGEEAVVPPGRAAAGSARRAGGPADASRWRSIATAMPPMLPICMSRITRSGCVRGDGVADVLAAGDLDDVAGRARRTRDRTWSRTHAPSAATRIVVLAGSSGDASPCASRCRPTASSASKSSTSCASDGTTCHGRCPDPIAGTPSSCARSRWPSSAKSARFS